MSLKTFVSQKDYPRANNITYQSLNEKIKQVEHQNSRIKNSILLLKATPDVKTYVRLNKNIEDVKLKLDKFVLDYNEINPNVSDSKLRHSIPDKLVSLRREVGENERAAKSLFAVHQKLEEKEKADKEEAERQYQISVKNAEQEALANQAEILKRDAETIVEGITVVNEVTKQLNSKLDEQHEQVLRVEDTMEEAHESMVKGNDDLATANEHQKGSTKKLCKWLLISIGIFIVLALLIGLSVGLTLR